MPVGQPCVNPAARVPLAYATHTRENMRPTAAFREPVAVPAPRQYVPTITSRPLLVSPSKEHHTVS